MIAGFSYNTHSTKGANWTGGADIAYCVAGSGPALLLLHGFPQTDMMWAEIAQELAKYFTVICVVMADRPNRMATNNIVSAAWRAINFPRCPHSNSSSFASPALIAAGGRRTDWPWACPRAP